MRKFKQALNELIETNPNGTDFICAMEFDKFAKRMFNQYKGFSISCDHAVPKGELYFINYTISPTHE